MNKGVPVFYALNNSSSMSLYEYVDGTMTTISRANREMADGEAFIGGPVSFGNAEHPFIFNENFNDTVYVLNDHVLTPSFLIKIGDYGFGYNELNYESLMNSSSQKFSTRWISSAGDYLFISYNVSNVAGKNDGNFLGLYNFRTKEYFRNVEFTDSSSQECTIRFDEQLYQGYNPNELLSIRVSPNSDSRYELIKYTVR